MGQSRHLEPRLYPLRYAVSHDALPRRQHESPYPRTAESPCISKSDQNQTQSASNRVGQQTANLRRSSAASDRSRSQSRVVLHSVQPDVIFTVLADSINLLPYL